MGQCGFSRAWGMGEMSVGGFGLESSSIYKGCSSLSETVREQHTEIPNHISAEQNKRCLLFTRVLGPWLKVKNQQREARWS